MSTMKTATISSSSSDRTTCLCGTRHRDGLFCAAGLARAQRLNATQRVLAVLRSLPVGTVVVHDTRGERATARTLDDSDVLARRYADGCEDVEWGVLAQGLDGEVRYQSDDGGAVPNSYKYRAEADRLDVVAAEGRVVVMVCRVTARRVPFGRGAVIDSLAGSSEVTVAISGGDRFHAGLLLLAREQARLERLAKLPRSPSIQPTGNTAISEADAVAIDALFASECVGDSAA
jgi:hypothetical protein